MIPGENLLNLANTIIAPTTVSYFRFVDRTENEIGYDISGYDAGVDIKANVQAVKRAQYSRMGLDYNKRYIALWTSTDVTDLLRDRSGDQVEYNNRRYELMNEEDWTPIDGWNAILAIEIRAA